MWYVNHYKKLISQFWFDAQGVSLAKRKYWNDKTRFWQEPPSCQICGDKWRPDKDPFVAVWGTIIETHNGLKWFCERLGLVRDTGHAYPHPRYVCRDCGEWPSTKVTDCFTGDDVTLRPRKAWLRRMAHKVRSDVLYWTVTAFRFARLCAGEIWHAMTQPRRYAKLLTVLKEMGL